MPSEKGEPEHVSLLQIIVVLIWILKYCFTCLIKTILNFSLIFYFDTPGNYKSMQCRSYSRIDHREFSS